MSKFKFELKVQGLEFKMEGSREDIPLMANSIGGQLAGLMQPATDMAASDDGKGEDRGITKTIDHSTDETQTKKSRRKRRTSTAPIKSENQTAAVDWAHDASKYGSPKQSWNTANKALWTLYVCREAAEVSQLSATHTAQIFNKKFKQARTISPSNVSRDFGKMKIANPSLVGEDTTKSPTEWYLTDEGVKVVQNLMADLLKQADGSN